MTSKIDRVASRMRDAYGVHCGEKWRPWAKAAVDKKAAWRACAEAAIAELEGAT